MIKIWQQLEQCIPEGLFALVWTLYFYNCCPDCTTSEKLNLYFWLILSQINWLNNQSVYLPGMRISIIQVNSGFSYTPIYFIFKINFICINFKIYFWLFIIILIRFLAVTLFLFSPSVMSNSLWPHGLQHTRLPCPSTSPGASSNSSPLSQWYHPMISSSVIPFSSCPFLLLPSIFPSIRVFSNELALHIRWPKYWSFNFGITPSSEYSGLIFFRTDWFDLPAVQGTLKSLLQHHSSKALTFQHSALFMVQLSHPYMTTGKTIALTIQIYVDKVMSAI